jgi:hypothetical protein
MLGKKKAPVTATHLLDQFTQGKKDDEVVDWLVQQTPPILMISGDSGRKSGQDPRLPALCPQRGITSIIIARKLCQVEAFEKIRMMMVCLPRMHEIYDGPRGKRYKLKRAGAHSYVIDDWPFISSLSSPVPNGGC